MKDNVCIPCVNEATNAAGDNAAGAPTSCVGGVTGPPTPSPTTTPAPLPYVDGCNQALRLDIFPEKTLRARVKNFAQHSLKSFKAGNLASCQEECVVFGNECKAVEYNFKNTACQLQSITSALGTVWKSNWNLFDRAHMCEPVCPDTTLG